MIKKVLLIEPPVTRPADFTSKKTRIGIVPPLGLAYIAAVLEKNNFTVKILDCLIEGSLEGIPYKNNQIRYGLSDEEIQQKISEFNPDVVGVSCLFSAKVYDMLNLCRIAKETDSHILTVTGGAHPTTAYNEVLKDKNLDFVIFGEGEYSTLELLSALNGKRELSNVDGLAYKEHDLVKVNPKTKYIENLDELPLPARHLLQMEKYINTSSPHSGIKKQPFTSMITSRGCPFHCSFCVIRNLWGTKARYRSPENVLQEIEELVTRYGIKEIHFEDDNLTAEKERAMAIFNRIIQKGWDLSLNSPSGLSVHRLDEELLSVMKKAGYYSISIAIESGDKDILRLMRKPVNLEKVKKLICTIHKLDLKTKGFFIIGYPGETKEQMQRTIKFAETANLDWALFFIATPIPGSDLDRYCRENGYLVDENLDYIKQFYISNIKTPEFEPEFVEQLREKANFEINFKNNYNLRSGHFDRAIEDIGDVTRLYPHLDFAHFYLGESYEKKGFKKKALDEYKIVLLLNKNYPNVKEKIKELETENAETNVEKKLQKTLK
jgi:anaerobic magnesium-protoporphyrin IX monomethyl ester cyclase